MIHTIVFSKKGEKARIKKIVNWEINFQNIWKNVNELNMIIIFPTQNAPGNLGNSP